ncbi:MAG: Rieske (2Fe-2S) protein [Thermoplasmata archaeon]|nr:Rieske (2Fe-2S) protein [Candidatus Sysuiplasma jiujiangense]MBX8641981.1 Rieske (2Fe-2S) protein [Candidatus Sysuiplasma jiujiangense]
MHFVKALKSSDLPEGQVRKVKLEGREFALVRKDGLFYCIDGVCTHEGGPLGEGVLVDGWLECPWHQGHFDYKTGNTDPETDWVTPVKAYRTRTEDGYVYVEI